MSDTITIIREQFNKLLTIATIAEVATSRCEGEGICIETDDYDLMDHWPINAVEYCEDFLRNLDIVVRDAESGRFVEAV